MEKLIRDGKVAVLYSPGFGAGWYTWNSEYPDCLFDPEIVQIVLGEKQGDIKEIVKQKYPSFYCGGADQLSVAWLPVGTPFRIDEYDGAESVDTGDDLFITA
jgi:hypothetical protein